MGKKIIIMKQLLYIILVSSFLYSCKKHEKPELNTYNKNNTPEQLVDDETIYEFLNSCTFSDSSKHGCKTYARKANYFVSSETNLDSLSIIKMDSIFSKKDIEFIFKQEKYTYYFELNENRIPENKNLVSLDTNKVFNNDWEIRNKYLHELLDENGAICFVSLPLFSCNRKIAIVNTSIYCGILCGAGGTYIYRKTDEGWILIISLNEWVS